MIVLIILLILAAIVSIAHNAGAFRRQPDHVRRNKEYQRQRRNMIKM